MMYMLPIMGAKASQIEHLVFACQLQTKKSHAVASMAFIGDSNREVRVRDFEN